MNDPHYAAIDLVRSGYPLERIAEVLSTCHALSAWEADELAKDAAIVTGDHWCGATIC